MSLSEDLPTDTMGKGITWSREAAAPYEILSHILAAPMLSRSSDLVIISHTYDMTWHYIRKLLLRSELDYFLAWLVIDLNWLDIALI